MPIVESESLAQGGPFVYNTSVLLLLTIACGPPDALLRPNKVAVAADKTLFVSDFHHHRVVHFSADGAHLGQVGRAGVGAGRIWQPTAMFSTSQGLVVVDREPTRDEVALQFVVKTFLNGEEPAAVIIEGEQETNWVDDLVLNADGSWYASDTTSQQIERWSPDWSEESVFLSGVKASSLVRDGNALYLVDGFSHVLTRLDTNGRVLWRNAGELSFPNGMDVCPGEWLAVADMGNHRVARFSLTGVFLDAVVPAPLGPDIPVQIVDVAVAPDCQSVWIVDSKGSRVIQTSLDGQVLVTISSW